MVTPLFLLPRPPGAAVGSSLLEQQGPPTSIVTTTTPGGMSLHLSPPRIGRLPNNQVWDFNFQLLLKFQQREGHMRVPVLHVEDGHKLGNWIRANRAQQKAGTLSLERVHRLHKVGFAWDGNVANITAFAQLKEQLRPTLPAANSQAGRWNVYFLLLLQYRDRQGHIRVPTQHVEDGQELGSWISMQRYQKRLGTLPSERERRLHEIGFTWSANDGKWETMIRGLIQFKQREGHCHVSNIHVEHMDGGVKLKLGVWLKKQRHHRGRGRVETKIVWKKLESIGVTWNNRILELGEAQWDRNFDLLLVFKEREGHVRVPTKHQESVGDQLGRWLKDQRSLYRHGALELDRQKWLEVAGVTWENWQAPV
jgi:hypothetical protein